MEIKQSTFQLQVKQLTEEGMFTGYASLFGVVDVQNDMVMPGAFARTLQVLGAEKVKMLWQHRQDEPIGTWTTIREDEKGLYVEGRLLMEVQRAREAYALLKEGVIDGLSIGYKVVRQEYAPDTDVRLLHEVELYEISMVTFPANQAAGITDLKAEELNTVREIEVYLRTKGFSAGESKTLLARMREVAGEEARDVQPEPAKKSAVVTRDAGGEALMNQIDLFLMGQKLDQTLHLLKGKSS